MDRIEYRQRVIALFGAKIAAYIGDSSINRTKAGACRDIWDACDELYLAGQPLDYDTVAGYLEAKRVYLGRGFAESNVRAELYGWRNFHNLPE